jgi:manganese efflux pump family protein
VVIKLLAFVLPLGLDSFAIAAALAAARPLTRRDRLQISALFVAFEAGMPLIGLALGTALAHAIGDIADYLAAAAVIAVGAWMLFGEDEDAEQEKAGRLTSAHGLAVIGLGISISLDELAIGFSLGLTHLPLTPVIIAIAVQAFIAAQLGLALGTRLSEHLRERAEQLAAVALIALGIVLIAEKVLA